MAGTPVVPDERQELPERKGWRFGRAIPVSIALHIAIAAVFLFDVPITLPVPEEPESVQVELVEPPPPPPEPEAPPPPPPPEPTVQEEEARAPIPSLPAIPIRPEPAPAGTGDQPDSGGDTPPEDMPEQPQEEAEPPPPAEEPPQPPSTASEEAKPPLPTAEDGELPAAENAAEAGTDLKAGSGESAEGEVPDPSAAPVPEAKPDNRQAAKRLLSKNTLNGAGMRQMLGDLPPRRRIVQMCSIEALAQIRQQRSGKSMPHGLVPFSETGGRIDGNRLDARGGAFNIGNDWFGIDFYCEVDMDNFTVTSFRFELGGPVSEAEARRRGYPRQ